MCQGHIKQINNERFIAASVDTRIGGDNIISSSPPSGRIPLWDGCQPDRASARERYSRWRWPTFQKMPSTRCRTPVIVLSPIQPTVRISHQQGVGGWVGGHLSRCALKTRRARAYFRHNKLPRDRKF